jgi:hypothetical protein
VEVVSMMKTLFASLKGLAASAKDIITMKSNEMEVAYAMKGNQKWTK